MRLKTSLAAIAATAFVALGAGTANAQQVNPGISNNDCLHGEIPSSDYALFESNYKDSSWDTSSKIGVWAQNGGGGGGGSGGSDSGSSEVDDDEDTLRVTITDDYGSQVCSDKGKNQVQCEFQFNAAYEGLFVIKIENFKNFTRSYRVCAVN